MIAAIVLGAGAGGGFPQWNSNAPGCNRARAGDPAATARTQTSVAVSADRRHWFVLNAAPDLRTQIERCPALHPTTGLRSSPIAGVVLAGAEVDAIAGLLCLREGQRLTLWAAAPTLAHLAANPIFDVLSPALVPRVPVLPDQPIPLTLPDGGASGLSLRLFAVPGKPPLYAQTAATPDDETTGIEITDGTHRLLFIPGCARMTQPLRERIRASDALFFDATLWQDDEMIAAGLNRKSGADMGHMSIDGPEGVLATLADVAPARRILIHLNNSNPVLLADTPQRAAVERAGWQVAWDGMEIAL